jgi:D-lactate dehydrogenase
MTASLATGYFIGRWSHEQLDQERFTDEKLPERVLPSGTPRGCCCESSQNQTESPLCLTKQEQDMVIHQLIQIVGSDNVISGMEENSTNALYLKGARLGRGRALAIVTPTSLEQAVQCLQVIVDTGCVCIPQGANTGLTGGSVPRQDNIRPSVILNMRKLDAMFPIDNGRRVVCLAGAGIATLSQNLAKWGFHDRESHSTLGSTFLNPSTAAGIAFGSGGTQLRKGPAYTDRALYVRVKGMNKWHENVLEIVNTLDIEGLNDRDFLPTNWSSPLKQLDLYARDVKNGFRRKMSWTSSQLPTSSRMASDTDYATRVCQCDHSVSRFNADTRGEDCNRSEGKVLILATVHDTFPKPKSTQSFWIAFQDLETALFFRREVCLNNPKDLPISCEYMDRDTFDVVDSAGRLLATLIKLFGVGDAIGMLWKMKLRIEAMSWEGADLICDRILYKLNNWIPPILCPSLMDIGKSMDHHILVTVGDFGDGELSRFMQRMCVFQEQNQTKMILHPCAENELTSITAFRFVCAPAFRTWCVGNEVQGISVDYALPKNGGSIPALDDGNQPLKRLRYSHFGCNVVHEDLAYDLGVNTHLAKMHLKKQVENQCGGKLPAEHGHGIEYHAPETTKDRWMKMDPLNVMNPGIGGLSMKYRHEQ